MDIRKVPNILTVIRAVLVPFFMVFIIFPILPTETWTRVVGAVVFALISLTDMLDGKIARKYNAVSDFGKFLDPIADKLLVIGGMIALIIFYMRKYYEVNLEKLAGFGIIGAEEDNTLCIFAICIAFSLFIVILRELAVTSLRLICKNTGGAVIAANMAGKIKTVSQIVFILAALVEPIIFTDSLWISYISLAVMTVMTVYSGINYFLLYLPYLKGKKNETAEEASVDKTES